MRTSLRSGWAVLALMAIAGTVCAGERRSSDERGLNLWVTDQATARDAGLPKYPNARPYKEGDQSSSAANVGLLTSLFGVKVVAIKYETKDAPERVARFYRRALAKYGKVLDCSDARRNQRQSKVPDDNALTCDADDPGEHTALFKVGTEDNHRLVALEPHLSGTRFSLVHVVTR